MVGTPREAVPSAVDRVVRPAHLRGKIDELEGKFRRERVVRLDPPVPRARAGLDEGEVDRRIRRRVQVDDDVVLADKVQLVVSDDSDPPRARGRRSRDHRHVRRRRRARRYLRERRDEARVTVAVRRAVEESRPVGERRLAQRNRGTSRFHKNRHADVAFHVDRGERAAHKRLLLRIPFAGVCRSPRHDVLIEAPFGKLILYLEAVEGGLARERVAESNALVIRPEHDVHPPRMFREGRSAEFDSRGARLRLLKFDDEFVVAVAHFAAPVERRLPCRVSA